MDREPGEALAQSTAILARLDGAGASSPRLLHGAGMSAWPLLAEVGHRGLDTRIGLEDTLTLQGGTLAADNADLVGAAQGVLASPP